MTKFSLVLLSAATLALGACSSEPSDFRPNQKVSVDAVAAGSRKTGLYPSQDRPDGAETHHTGATHEGAAHEGAAGEVHEPADASEAAATGSDVQKSAVGEPAVRTATPESRAAADSAKEAVK